MKLFLFLLSLWVNLVAESIVFVHIGPRLPDYLSVALKQARLFNKECPIYLIGNQEAFNKLSFKIDRAVTCIPCESLVRSRAHDIFISRSRHDKQFSEGFWTFTSERFFYLEELIRQYELTDVVHLENDVMLYMELDRFIPLFRNRYPGMIGATFDNDSRCIPGFLYISNFKPIAELVSLMAAKASEAKNDMEIFQEFKNLYHRLYIDHLPILIPEYCLDHKLKNDRNGTTNHPEYYTQYFGDFRSVFDAAAIGQYLGGISPRNGPATPGFVNESCLFNPSFFSFKWKRDGEKRWVPFMGYKNLECPINNLHIHSKNLERFFSGGSLPPN